MPNVNFIDDDNDPATPVQRLGGIARYDLSNGSWQLVGTNPALFSLDLGHPLLTCLNLPP